MALRSNKESIGMAAMQAMLRMDPLAAAEKVTSASYKEDEATEQLGLVFAIMHNRKKREMLEAAGDTYGHMSFGAYLSVIVDMGFEHQLADPFGKEGDVFYIFYRKPGLILAFDTYRGRSINGGKLYYNWRQKRKMPPSCFSSGGWRPRTPEIEQKLDALRGEWRELWRADPKSEAAEAADKAYQGCWNAQQAEGGVVWVGNHDCREALRHNVTQLEEYGEFIEPWAERPFLWSLTYEESSTRSVDYEKITEERISRLPPHVRTVIGK